MPVLLGVFHLQGLTLLPWNCLWRQGCASKSPFQVYPRRKEVQVVAVLESLCSVAVSSPQTRRV